MVAKNKEVKYPDEWDRSDNSFVLYDKCKSHYSEGQERDLYNAFIPSKLYDIFCVAGIIYSVLSLLTVIVRRDIFRRASRSMILTILFAVGTVLNVTVLYISDKNFYEFPCFLIPFITSITFPLNFFSCAGNILIYLKQCYANESLYDEHNDVNLENIEKAGSSDSRRKRRNETLFKLCLWFTKKRILSFLIIYITLSMIHINLIASLGRRYSMSPVTYGFCFSDFEKIPNVIITLAFMYIFIPTVVREILRFRGSFSYGKPLYISLVIIFITCHLYLFLSSLPFYYCSQLNRYLTPDFFVIFMFLTFTYFQITIPIIDANKLSKTVGDLEINKKGLLQVFGNDILYKEFFAYAVSKRSVEYATFHVEYLEFKEIFNINKSFLEEFKDNPIVVPGPEPSNQKDKKLLEIFAAIYDKADEIFNKYFSEESELELNLSAKLVKKITTALYEYNINYNRYFINGTEGHTVDYKLVDCENIFDEVHEEALDSLFLNVYKGFIKEIKKSPQNSGYSPVKTSIDVEQV